MTAIRLLFVYLAVPLLFGGCATSAQMTVSDLTVHLSTTVSNRSSATLSVAKVKSDDRSAHFRVPIDPEVFRQALVISLKESGLFASVSIEQGGNFTLESEIIHQAPVDEYSVTLPLLVHYKLRETRTGRVVWKINAFSQPKIPYTRSEAGATGELRHKTIVSAAIQDNFKQTLESIRQRLAEGL